MCSPIAIVYAWSLKVIPMGSATLTKPENRNVKLNTILHNVKQIDEIYVNTLDFNIVGEIVRYSSFSMVSLISPNTA